ncbi:hypothetical protein BV25DRAFT_1181002 [Artomyces pyxidatus]|uniref:Uncharacterized protein n=1 Tax=Artomyces pyxidatus TaxID=48021 RepID=A0ACB8SQN3_9AGAM|nr:hypothetical protein BV25DRAFT_1181002 [Artomyces pyxidatus]
MLLRGRLRKTAEELHSLGLVAASNLEKIRLSCLILYVVLVDLADVVSRLNQSSQAEDRSTQTTLPHLLRSSQPEPHRKTPKLRKLWPCNLPSTPEDLSGLKSLLSLPLELTIETLKYLVS